ncbi:hypothetical protein BO225_05365 [Dubosiella newyorkensis]|uniref:DUF2335 domain-containing protein n=2 Tax=Dubosiella newyorkensis TaxID=1862672 RepID=A0A1U7NMT4_9FIRM|nr:hypothetical protein BO225_05365 [Dubosiella newyorkensis]
MIMKDNTKTDNEPLTPTEQDSEIQQVEAEIDKLSPRQRNLVIERYEESSQIYEGPLPPASELIKYNEAHPDAADRIIAMAEKEQEARLVNATYMLREDAKTKKRGQFMGFIIALIVLGGGMFLLSQGRALEGFTTLVGAAATLVFIFISGRYQGSDKDGDK